MCDADAAPCGPAPRSRGVFSIGAIGRCLSKRAAEGLPLQPDCKQLVMVAAPKVGQDLLGHDLLGQDLLGPVGQDLLG